MVIDIANTTYRQCVHAYKHSLKYSDRNGIALVFCTAHTHTLTHTHRELRDSHI